VNANDAGSTVLLSDEERGRALADRLAGRELAADRYASVGDLVRARPLSSVGVLALLCRPRPSGLVLVTLGRMNVEYPTIQKIVLLDDPLPLPIAEYLTACGVDIVHAGAPEEDLDRLASAIENLQERKRWIAS
jgi:hypothetical protein